MSQLRKLSRLVSHLQHFAATAYSQELGSSNRNLAEQRSPKLSMFLCIDTSNRHEQSLTAFKDDGIVVGPALAHRLLLPLGTVEQVITADEITLMQVPGLGRTKARQIREIIS